MSCSIGDIRPGILPREYLEILSAQRLLIDCNEVEDSAVDLHLGKHGWKMRGAIKPGPREEIVSLTQKDFCSTNERIDLSNATLLQPKSTYLILLKESVDFQENKHEIHGVATGKSSVGRLDVLTRLVVNRHEAYDEIPPGYSGPLYIEITPITFPIKVCEGVSLNQLRLFRGDPSVSMLGKDQIDLYGGMVATERKNCCELSLDLSPVAICDKDVIAFKAKNRDFSDRPIDLTVPSVTVKPNDYWEVVEPQPDDYIRIKPESFYILRSEQRFKLPKDVGVYCKAITENLGEIRIHYAGFVHPGFGLENAGRGTPLIFEVRGHTAAAFLRHGELIARIEFYRTSKESDPEPGVYDDQELKLSKYFGEWEC